MIKVIFWDVDGTLLDFLAAEKAAVKRCFEIFQLGACPDEAIEQYSAINVRYWQMLERGEMTKPQILVGRFAEFFRARGLDASIAVAFNDEYQLRLGDTIRFFDGALETVQALKARGVVQCAATNGTKVAQDNKLARSGLDRLFDHIFISEEMGCEKPGRAFFDRALAAVGPYARNEVMIVGDSLTSDMRGGVNAGVVTCWFNPSHAVNTGNLPIDYEIERLSQVLSLVCPPADAENRTNGEG